MLPPTWNHYSGQKHSTSDILKLALLFFLHHYCLYQGFHLFFFRLLKSLFCLIILPSALTHSDSFSILKWFFSPKYKFHHATLYFFPPDISVGKESACNSGDPGSIPGSGRSTGEGIGYPLQYSWASLVAQLVKNPPAMQETWVRSLGWEDPLEKGKATHSSILAWRTPWTV